jgi:uncharacterized protein (TIRG00374 family)
MKKPSNPQWKRLLKLIGPIFFIFLLIRVIDPGMTADLIKGLKPEIALLSMLMSPVVIAALTLRWWLTCLRLRMDTTVKNLFQISYISWFLGLVPIVGISPLSKYIYLKDEGKSSSATAVSITVDKLFDVIGLMAFGIFGLLYFPRDFFNQTYLWIIFAGMLLCGFVALAFGSKIWSALTGFFKRYTNKKLLQMGSTLSTDLAEFWSGFNLKFFLMILGLSIAIGLLRSLVLYLLAVSLSMPVGFGFIVACRALIGIANVIPITINGIGTRDAVLLLALPLVGVSKEAAIALSCLMFLWLICSKFSGIFFWLTRPLPSGSIRGLKNPKI